MTLEIAILVNKQHNEDQVGLGYKTKSPIFDQPMGYWSDQSNKNEKGNT